MRMTGPQSMGLRSAVYLPSLSGEDAASTELQRRPQDGAGSSSSSLPTWAAC